MHTEPVVIVILGWSLFLLGVLTLDLFQGKIRWRRLLVRARRVWREIP